MSQKYNAPLNPTADQRQEVVQMLTAGATMVDLCDYLGCTEPTVRKYFKGELKTARAFAKRDRAEDRDIPDALDYDSMTEEARNIAVEQAIFAAASDPAHAKFADMARLWARCRMGWQDAAPAAKGKKAEAAERAKTAGEGSEWGSDLTFPGASPN